MFQDQASQGHLRPSYKNTMKQSHQKSQTVTCIYTASSTILKQVNPKSQDKQPRPPPTLSPKTCHCLLARCCHSQEGWPGLLSAGPSCRLCSCPQDVSRQCLGFWFFHFLFDSVVFQPGLSLSEPGLPSVLTLRQVKVE